MLLQRHSSRCHSSIDNLLQPCSINLSLCGDSLSKSILNIDEDAFNHRPELRCHSVPSKTLGALVLFELQELRFDFQLGHHLLIKTELRRESVDDEPCVWIEINLVCSRSEIELLFTSHVHDQVSVDFLL